MSNILRVQTKSGNFTIIANEPLQDPALSWKAKGLLVYLLSKPDNWKVNPEQLRKASVGGRDAVYSILKELIQAGYIIRRLIRNQQGQASGYEYIVLENKGSYVEPVPPLPFPENPQMAKPQTGNPDISNTDSLLKTDIAGQAPAQTKEEKLYEEKKAFCKRVIDFVRKNPNKYPKALYVEFTKYWLEMNDNGRGKMRFQKQDAFQMSRRLETWSGNTSQVKLDGFWQQEAHTKALNIQLAEIIKN